MKKISLGLILTAFITFVSCGSQPQQSESVMSEKDVFAMDTFMTMKAYGTDSDKALEKAEKRIIQLEDELSVTKTDSDISRINSAGGEDVEVSDDTAVLVKAAQDYGKLTNGALDVTVYPVLAEWGFTTGEYHIPDEDTIKSLLENVGYENISLSGNTVQIPPEYQIDMGALAKGYTGDMIMDIFRENGVTSGIISLGGNIQTIGKKPDGSQWRVSVRDPFSPDDNLCILEISDKAVITSGNYERFFTGDDGKNYWHIIDPNDGYPADNGLVSVTIIGENGLMCDALSTALFSAGTEKAKTYWKEHGDFDMVLVTDDKHIIYTDGLSGSFENVSGLTDEVLTHD